MGIVTEGERGMDVVKSGGYVLDLRACWVLVIRVFLSWCFRLAWGAIPGGNTLGEVGFSRRGLLAET